MKVSHYLFEREQYRRQRCIERGRNSRCCAGRQKRLYFFVAQSQETSKH